MEGKGASYTWKSDNSKVGNGTMSITDAKPNEWINIVMDFGENGKASGAFKIEKLLEGTKITWSMDSNLGTNPIARYFGLFMDKMVGADFEKGLKNLDKVTTSITTT